MEEQIQSPTNIKVWVTFNIELELQLSSLHMQRFPLKLEGKSNSIKSLNSELVSLLHLSLASSRKPSLVPQPLSVVFIFPPLLKVPSANNLTQTILNNIMQILIQHLIQSHYIIWTYIPSYPDGHVTANFPFGFLPDLHDLSNQSSFAISPTSPPSRYTHS